MGTLGRLFAFGLSAVTVAGVYKVDEFREAGPEAPRGRGRLDRPALAGRRGCGRRKWTSREVGSGRTAPGPGLLLYGIRGPCPFGAVIPEGRGTPRRVAGGARGDLLDFSGGELGSHLAGGGLGRVEDLGVGAELLPGRVGLCRAVPESASEVGFRDSGVPDCACG